MYNPQAHFCRSGETAYATDSKSVGETHGGSNPPSGTSLPFKLVARLDIHRQSAARSPNETIANRSLTNFDFGVERLMARIRPHFVVQVLTAEDSGGSAGIGMNERVASTKPECVTPVCISISTSNTCGIVFRER